MWGPAREILTHSGVQAVPSGAGGGKREREEGREEEGEASAEVVPKAGRSS